MLSAVVQLVLRGPEAGGELVLDGRQATLAQYREGDLDLFDIGVRDADSPDQALLLEVREPLDDLAVDALALRPVPLVEVDHVDVESAQ